MKGVKNDEAMGDTAVTSYKDLIIYLESNTKIGDTVEVAFYREKEKKTKKMKVAERPKQLSINKITTKKK
jgi:S1-C subfamily serine protease